MEGECWQGSNLDTPALGTEKKAAPHFTQLLAIHLAGLVAVQACHT